MEPLPKEEVGKLWVKAKKGDKKAKKKLTELNLRLVIPIAKRFMRKGVDFLDIINEGNMGLIKAVEKFNPKRNVSFSTYATYWIEHYIRKAIETQAKTIRIPSHIWDSLNLWMKTWNQLREKLAREPRPDEVAAKLKLSKRQTKSLMKASAVFSGTSSLESPVGDDEDVFVKDIIVDDAVKTPESITEMIRVNSDVRRAIDQLEKREATIIKLRFGLDGAKPESLDTIGKKLKISRERVRQLEEKALGRLRGIFVRHNLIDKEHASKFLIDQRGTGKDRRKSQKKVPKSILKRRKGDRRT
jgi:RNA polymerase primary sigma factor